MPKLKYAQGMAAAVLRGVWVRVEGPAQRSHSQAVGKDMPGSWEARAEGHGCEQHGDLQVQRLAAVSEAENMKM